MYESKSHPLEVVIPAEVAIKGFNTCKGSCNIVTNIHIFHYIGQYVLMSKVYPIDHVNPVFVGLTMHRYVLLVHNYVQIYFTL